MWANGKMKHRRTHKKGRRKRQRQEIKSYGKTREGIIYKIKQEMKNPNNDTGVKKD